MKTFQAYRFALDPNTVRLAALRRHAGAGRFAYNWGLVRV
ncbi:helix-turn-helix domain-containing protein, partial [Frankia sp. CgS1]